MMGKILSSLFIDSDADAAIFRRVTFKFFKLFTSLTFTPFM